MSVITRILNRNIVTTFPKSLVYYSSKSSSQEESGEFRTLNFKNVRTQFQRRKLRKVDVLPPRNKEMPVDQDWGSVWPGPRTFHPATVPLPLRQGYVEKGSPPDKFGNAELMKIPNFLHLTPPVIQRQCESIKKFCTQWPKALDTDEKCEKHFPMEITFSNYCHSSPTIRDPLARIVTVKLKLSNLKFDEHARDKFMRLVGDRYDEKTDQLTIVTDRCPTKKQNYDYAMYLITALYHEAWIVEPWEEQKSEADMEYYDWSKSASKLSLEAIFAKATAEIPEGEQYSNAVSSLMNEGESEYTINNYSNAVRKLINLPSPLEDTS